MLDYARPGAKDPRPRLSALAVTCFVACLVVCPCMIGVLVNIFDRPLRRALSGSAVLFALFWLPSLCVLVAAFCSLVRIHRSRGRIWGTALSAWALALSAL